jgi:hypothetical protein
MQNAFAAVRFFPITPNDNLPLMDDGRIVTGAVKCIQGGSAGNVALLDGLGFPRVYPIQPGETIQGVASKVFLTGTTATGLWLFCPE